MVIAYILVQFTPNRLEQNDAWDMFQPDPKPVCLGPGKADRDHDQRIIFAFGG